MPSKSQYTAGNDVAVEVGVGGVAVGGGLAVGLGVLVGRGVPVGMRVAVAGGRGVFAVTTIVLETSVFVGSTKVGVAVTEGTRVEDAKGVTPDTIVAWVLSWKGVAE